MRMTRENAKAIAAALVTLIGAAVQYFAGAQIPAELTASLVAILTTSLVWIVPNKPRDSFRAARYRAVLLCVLVPSFASQAAAQGIVVLSYEQPGRYVVQIDVPASGDPVVTQHQPTRLATPGTAPVPDTDDGDPLPSSEVSEAVRRAAEAVDRPDVAVAVAAIYEGVAQRVSSGEIQSADTAMQVVRTLTDVVLAEQDATEAFQPVRDTVTEAFTRLYEAGELDHEQHLREVAVGLRASADGALVNLDVGTVLKLIGIVVDARRRGEVLTVETMLAILAALGGLE